jgi:hypothetical protein
MTVDQKCQANGDYHRYFALEPICQQMEQKILICLACTQCGELKNHVVDLNKALKEN